MVEAATGDAGIVATTGGTLSGALSSGVHVFKGIPYAAPPTGQRRFAPPTPLQPWTGVRDATAYGARSIQPLRGLNLAPAIDALLRPAALEPTSEDCLFLNIWTPALGDGGKRPVMVWLHGGAFVSGSGGSAMYDGTNLAGREDVVVVTLNHRLGLLGYLNLAELGGERFASSGTAGMLDIIAALHWLRDNIAAFGGDAGNVTLFGESGGGAKICTLLAMPAAQGLFHKGIVQSGPAVEMMPASDATAVARRVLDHLGIAHDRPEALLDLPADALLEAQIAILKAVSPMSFAQRRRNGFNPVINGRDLPRPPFVPDAPPTAADVPLLIGTNKDEMTLFWATQPWLEEVTDGTLVDAVSRFMGARAEPMIAAYRSANPNASPRDIVIAIGSDQGMRIPSLIIADRKTAQAAPVWVYLFTWETPAIDGKLGAPHAVEIPFVFDTLESAGALTGNGPERQALALAMSRSWAQFARTGNPNGGDLPSWPAYNVRERPTMIFDRHCRVERDPRGAERRAWSES